MKKTKKRGNGKSSTSTRQNDDFLSGPGRNKVYEASDSEDDYTQQEKMLLEKVRTRSSQSKPQKKVAVMDLPLHDDNDEVDSDDNDAVSGDSDNSDVNMDSDIEGKEDDFHLPDQKAWGKSKRNYYNTDYVDQDYGGFDGDDAEDAELEEQEAREIQKRLAAELDDNDFTLDVFAKAKEDHKGPAKATEEIIKTDLSELSTRQKLALLQKEAPELIGLISEFRDLMEELHNRLQPAIGLVHAKQVSSPQLIQYIRTKYHLVNNYVMNMGFYLLLRAQRHPVAAHPVVKRLLQYRQLLQQLEPLENQASSKIQDLIDQANNGSLLVPQDNEQGSSKKIKNLLFSSAGKFSKEIKSDEFESESGKVTKAKDKQKSNTKSVKAENTSGELDAEEDMKMLWDNNLEEGSGGAPWLSGFNSDSAEGSEDMDESGPLAEDDQDEDGSSKRAITWQMAKNKGLTPHRKKEQRNPRVKHRNKFRKAKIRRKGQVREPRTEVKRYGGEFSGIKKSVTKSIKIK